MINYGRQIMDNTMDCGCKEIPEEIDLIVTALTYDPIYETIWRRIFSNIYQDFHHGNS